MTSVFWESTLAGKMNIVEKIEQLQQSIPADSHNRDVGIPEVVPDQSLITNWVEKTVTDTNILVLLRELQSKILSGAIKSCSITFLPDKEKVVMAWGNEISLDENGCVESFKHCDFSYILCRLNHVDQSIRFWGNNDEPILLSKDDYIKNNDVVADAIAQVFLDPAKELHHPLSAEPDNEPTYLKTL